MTYYWEDFTAGEVIELGTVTVDTEEMIAFSRRFDPQPFHVDPEAAAATPFGGIIASGWYSGSLFMRMWVDSVLGDSTSLGSPGLSELRWLSPIRGGDVLIGRAHVLETYPSAHNPNRGTVILSTELLRDDEVVMRIGYRNLFGRRHPASS